MDWTSGYVAEIDYVHGYYRELSPGLLRLACLSASVTPPAGEGLTYLELGYGQGISINMHAAAVPGTFWGTDFNPAQAVNAQAMAAASQSGATLVDESFEELAARPDLPEFDIIALHGIWSWVSDANRRTIVDLIRRKLRVGGLVYISYNALPGWAPALPLRHLITLHAETAGSEQSGLVAKIDDALTFAKKVVDSGAWYFRANPQVAQRLERLSALDRHYLAHEYFNRDWAVMSFSEVAGWLEGAKLSFVGSVNLQDHLDMINLTAEGQKLVGGIQHPILRQTVRDYFINQQFRRDIFVKGPRSLSPLEQVEALRAQPYMLIVPPDAVPTTMTTPLGEAELEPAIYRPLVDCLADGNHSPQTAAQLLAKLSTKSVEMGQLQQALSILTSIGVVEPAREPTHETRRRCALLNRYIFERARSIDQIRYVVSPVTGSGIRLDRLQQLFLLAREQGKKTPNEWAAYAWHWLAMHGQSVTKDGKALETSEANMAELNALATHLNDKGLAILRTLGVA